MPTSSCCGIPGSGISGSGSSPHWGERRRGSRLRRVPCAQRARQATDHPYGMPAVSRARPAPHDGRVRADWPPSAAPAARGAAWEGGGRRRAGMHKPYARLSARTCDPCRSVMSCNHLNGSCPREHAILHLRDRATTNPSCVHAHVEQVITHKVLCLGYKCGGRPAARRAWLTLVV